jgi:putative component of toxin-antitoxin plasmid stabilization module
MPASRALGAGLFDHRLDLARTAWRITYDFAGDHRIVLLTVFRKQQQNERTNRSTTCPLGDAARERTTHARRGERLMASPTNFS